MKKLCCMVALAAISFGSVYAYGIDHPIKTSVQDTTKKKMKKMKKDSTGKDTTKHR